MTQFRGVATGRHRNGKGKEEERDEEEIRREEMGRKGEREVERE